jgi:hypothetical protein
MGSVFVNASGCRETASRLVANFEGMYLSKSVPHRCSGNFLLIAASAPCQEILARLVQPMRAGSFLRPSRKIRRRYG